jgi:hypothetical protein
MVGKKCNAHVRGGMCLGGGKYCTTEVRLLATECTGSYATTNAQVSPCAAGQHPVELNGQVLCVGAGGAGTTPSKTERVERLKADGTTEVIIRQVNCLGTDCGYTETKKQFDSGGTQIGNAETTSGSQKGLDAGLPGGSGSGGGVDLSVGAGPELGTKSVGLSAITPHAGLASSGSCPSPIALPLGMTFEWTFICQYATTLRPLVLALAWLGGMFIVVGGFKKG